MNADFNCSDPLIPLIPVVIIAHRLTAVRHADVIYVIERGRVVEQGAHHELIEHSGHYARLYGHQAQGAVVTPIGS